MEQDELTPGFLKWEFHREFRVGFPGMEPYTNTYSSPESLGRNYRKCRALNLSWLLDETKRDIKVIGRARLRQLFIY